MPKCALCKKEYQPWSYGLRIAYIEHATRGPGRYQVGKGYGMYEPRLMIDELHKLNRGEYNICTIVGY